MKKIGIVGPSYQEKMLPFDAQRTVNLYPVFDKSGKEVAALYGTPGLTLFAGLGNGGNRGHFCAANGRAFVVIGSGFYELNSAGGANLLGSLNSSSGIVSMNENGFQLGICDGDKVYMFNYASGVFTLVTTPNLLSAGTITFIDGYFVVNDNNTGRMQISALYDGLTWAALDYATAESSPDNLLRVFNALGQLWLLGLQTTEVWTNTGASKFPFQRISGAKLEVGILAPHTAVAVDNSLVWVGRDNIGQGIVYKARGFTPQRISTSPIEYKLQSAPDPTNLRAYTYQNGGHTFYVITGGGMDTSLVYDLATQLWHERAYLNSQGVFEQHLGACGMFAFGVFLVGDRNTGNVYTLDETAYTDNGDPLCRERTYTHISDMGKRIRYNSLEIGFESGVGTQVGQGFDPQCSLQLSKDGARTWSSWFTAPFGRVGQYMTKTVFRRLGIAEQMTFKIRITDPVPVRICGSYLA